MNKAFMVQGNTVSDINPNFTVEPKIPVGVYDMEISYLYSEEERTIEDVLTITQS